jgi:hypothetical protein
MGAYLVARVRYGTGLGMGLSAHLTPFIMQNRHSKDARTDEAVCMGRVEPQKVDSSRPDLAATQTLDLYQIRAQLLVRDARNPPAEPRPPVSIHGLTRAIAGGVRKTSARVSPLASTMAEKLTRTVPIAASSATTVITHARRSAIALARALRLAAREFAERVDFPTPPASSPATRALQPAPSDDVVRHNRETHLARLRLAARESTLGFNHPDVASALHLLGALEHEAHRFNEALALYSTALVIRQRTLGNDHPEVVATRVDLEAARRDEADDEARVVSQ